MKLSTAYYPIGEQLRCGRADEELLTRRRARASVAIHRQPTNRRLEDLVGKLLFERDTRTVTLTRDGEALQSYAVRILDLMSEEVEQFRAPALSGHVRLGLSEDFASTGLTAPMVGFLRRNPEVELTIEIGMSGDLFRRLDEGRYDLVFAKRRHGSRRGRVVRSEPLIWCAGAQASNMKSADVVPLVLHPEPSVTR